VTRRYLTVQNTRRFREHATPFGDTLASDSERYYFHATLEGLAATGRKNLESIPGHTGMA